ncbi:MAG: transglutaminase domain-containing protein [Gammaproteobacteria bacterium]|nr:transglutaminase domain-containing protein [Gammaproteobacteria bacterium]
MTHTPPFLVGVGLILWGWQCDYIMYAIVMALLLEASHWISWRWSITDREFNYIADLCSIIFLFVIIYVFTVHSIHGIFIILSLLPFFFFLLILAQVYSTQEKIKLSALFISMRRLESDMADSVMGIDLTFPYLFVCMISASAGNQHTILFFIFICILTAWTLWIFRPGRYPLSTWALFLIMSFPMAYAGQIGIQTLQAIVETTFLDWFDQFMWRSRDPNRTITAIGSLGRLKLSDRIMVRVDAGKQFNVPLLIREATYNTYGYGIWTNLKNSFNVIDPSLGGRSWVLNKTNRAQNKITISTFLEEDKAVIPVPHGASVLTNLTAAQIETSPYGGVILELNPGWLKYDVLYNQDQSFDTTPDKEDLEIPPLYKKDFEKIAMNLQLDAKSRPEIVHTIKQFFANNFRYSLTQQERYPRGKYLSKFLFETRKGHCEYFATSTALLLRAAGIPSRYAVGYSIQEYSHLEGQYIARARHAHSWVLAYVNKTWQVIDTTPALWAPLEEENSSAIEPFVDIWSWLSYKLSTWNVDDPEKMQSAIFIWLLIPLIGYFAWRIYFKERMAKIKKNQSKISTTFQKLGSDSSLYKLIAQIEQLNLPRRPGETLPAWISRIEGINPYKNIQPILTLHYRYRFDPAGVEATVKQEMNALIEIKLKKLA